MAGVMPSTNILLAKYDLIVGHFDRYSDILYYLGIEIRNVDDSWQLFLAGKPQLPVYGDSWESNHDIIVDWARHHMKLPSGYKTYRYLT